MNDKEEKLDQSDDSGKGKVLRILWIAAILIPPVWGTAAINREIDSADLIVQFDDRMKNERVRLYHREVLNDLKDKGKHSVRYGVSRPHLWTLLSGHHVWEPGEIKTLYIGSSLGMPFDSELADVPASPVTFLNASLSAPSIRDHLIVFEMLKRKGIQPDRVILEINPWSLVKETGDIHKYLKHAGRDILTELNVLNKTEEEDDLTQSESSRWDQLELLFSPSYLQHNLEFASKNLIQNLWVNDPNKEYDKRLIVREFPIEEHYTLFADLSIRWSDEKKSRNTQEVRQIITRKSNLQKNSRGEVIPTRYCVAPLNQRRLDEFELLLKLIELSGASVEFFFLPPHPFFIEYQKELAVKTGDSFTFGNSFDYVVELAKKKKILVRGRYLPKKESGHFIDNYHQGYEGIRNDFNQILYEP